MKLYEYSTCRMVSFKRSIVEILIGVVTHNRWNAPQNRAFMYRRKRKLQDTDGDRSLEG